MVSIVAKFKTTNNRSHESKFISFENSGVAVQFAHITTKTVKNVYGVYVYVCACVTISLTHVKTPFLDFFLWERKEKQTTFFEEKIHVNCLESIYANQKD